MVSSLVKKGFDKLRLSISVKKSQVIYPMDGDWDLFDDNLSVS